MSSHAQHASRPAAREPVGAAEIACDPRIRREGEHPLLWVLGAAAGGIISDRWMPVPLLLWCLLFATSLPLSHWLHSNGHPWSSAALILVSVAALTGLWHHDRWNLYPGDDIARWADERPIPVLVRVIVRDAPRHSPAARAGPMSTMTRGETTRLDVRVVAVRCRSHWRPASGRAALIVEGHLSARDALRGDHLQVAALLAGVRPPLNPGEPNFALMCRSRRQSAVLLCGHAECVQRIKCGGSGSVLRQLGQLRLRAELALDRYVGPRRSALAAALLLGSRERLDQETVHTYFVSGTLHLLAISGLHVGILATSFWFLVRLNWWSRKRVLWVTCVAVVSYALLTGARPPVVRAAILIVVYCLARGTGRSPQAWNSLAAAGLITIAIRPAGLFDTGTQLSFLAVGTLIAAWPRIFNSAARDPLQQLIAQSRPLWMRGSLAVATRVGQLLLLSSVVWLISLPLVAYRFHLVAPLGLVLNVLLWLPLAAALFTGLLTVVTAPVPWLPDLFGWCCDLSLSVIELLTNGAAQLPRGYLWVAGPAWWWVAVFYAGLMLWQFTPLPLARRWWHALLAGWIAVGIVCGSGATRAWRMVSAQPLRVSFVAVGHGASVLVELPDGKVVLYDAGRMGNPRAAALPISSVLWSHRIRHIDALVLSHADADHFNAVPELLDRFSVGIIYVSPIMFRSQSPALTALQSAIDNAGVPVGQIHENLHLSSRGRAVMEVLHPPPHGCAPGSHDRSDNSNSVVMQLTCGRYRILLTGDIEDRGLDELLAESPLPCDVLMAPHHGSRHSRPADILQWTGSAVVVISAGASLSVAPAESAYARDGASVFWTHRDGLVEIVTDGRQLRVSTWRRGRE